MTSGSTSTSAVGRVFKLLVAQSLVETDYFPDNHNRFGVISTTAGDFDADGFDDSWSAPAPSFRHRRRTAFPRDRATRWSSAAGRPGSHRNWRSVW